MMRRYTYNNIVKAARLLSLVVLMVFGAGLKGWGQEDEPQYTIEPQDGKKFPQENVPTLVDTVYVKEGETRMLQYPELADPETQGSSQYKWYIRWYRVRNGEVLPIDGFLSQNKGLENPLRKTSDGKSLFWHHGFAKKQYYKGADKVFIDETMRSVATVNYTSDGETDTVYCDVSPNIDGLGRNPKGPTYVEPTITKRHKFIIKNAVDMVDRLNSLSHNAALDTFYITVPFGAKNVNVHMNMTPENYYWLNFQGSDFKLSESSNLTLNSKRIINIQGEIPEKRMTIDVRAVSGENESPIIARYIITTQGDSGFLMDEEIKPENKRRNPSLYPEEYEEIGSYDFNQDEPATELSIDNNIWMDPLSSDITSYGFSYPGLYSITREITPKRDHYGLYRSANNPDKSKDATYYEEMKDIWGKGARYGEKDDGTYIRETDRVYEWFVSDELSNSFIYDRTHVDSLKYVSKVNYGHFFYVDASTLAGRIVKVPIDGTVCQHTELTITAWVATMVSGNIKAALPPNINMILIGEKEGKSVVLHRFSSGEMPVEMKGNDVNEWGVWRQLCYNVRIDDAYSYDDFYLEVQNNALNSQGADYAFDDVRIYRTKPNIKVKREDACDASTLTVSSDYGTLLRNMGYSMNEVTVDAEDKFKDDLDLIPYRLGLYGANSKDMFTSDSYIFNTYFSFAEGIDDSRSGPDVVGVDSTRIEESDLKATNPTPIILGPKDNEEAVGKNGDVYRWVRINKNVSKFGKEVVFAYRSIITTRASDLGNYPTDRTTADKWEKVYNLRAVKDFNYLVNNWGTIYDDVNVNKPDWLEGQDSIPLTDLPSDLQAYLDFSGENISENDLPLAPASEERYNEITTTLWSQLKIPRIRVPWYDADKGIMYLHSMDVNNTDLKYRDEIVYDNAGKPVTATGKYHVVLQSARAVGGGAVDVKEKCTLISPFTVEPSVTFTVNPDADLSNLLCRDSKVMIKAELNGTDGTELTEGYSFDWYLGPLEEYNKLIYGNNSLKEAIVLFRRENPNKQSFSMEDVANWKTTSEEEIVIKKGLLELFANDLLRIDHKDFTWFVKSPSIVAMPFITGSSIDNALYCTDATELRLNVLEDVPQAYPGIVGVVYPKALSSVPIRLGVRHIKENNSLTIPIRGDNLVFGTKEGQYIIDNPDNNKILLYQEGTSDAYPVVATLNQFSAERETKDEATGTVTGGGGSMTLIFNGDAKSHLAEGRVDTLLIPIYESESENETDIISFACDGYAKLPVKVVPEYLTWKGDGSAVWYNDKNWNQSTEGELYFDQGGTVGTSTADANGSDPDLTKAFAPLYFTKITIPKGKQLTLDKPETGHVNSPILDFQNDKDTTKYIQYDMAVDTVTDASATDKITVVPYYINKVSEIYFKPEATLMNQHYLLYDTARVEFTMKQNTPYWMASPLKAVYAGDLYAPTGGTQNTPAFNHIVFNTNDYNRWGPAFYQKAWNKAVAYMNSDEDEVSHNSADAIDVKAVKSNWSIEYNDVWVPYPVGKGFYASVEGVTGGGDVTVRLPKADTEYLYYQTKAAKDLSPDPEFSDGQRKGQAGQLATEKPTFTRDQATFVFEYKFNGEISLNLDDVYGESSTDVEQGEPRHFLVGNPYMTYLDMEAFFDNNLNLNRKFWTLKNGAPDAIVGTPDVEFEGENRTLGSVSETVKPMEAFFVELKNDATSTTITFTDGMMASTEQPAAAETKSLTASNPILTLMAERGETRSVARLLTSDKGHDEYEASEDAVLLLDSELDAPMVYTVAGDVAAQFNTLRSIKNVPLGIYNKKGDEVTLTISGLSRLVEPLYLYDAWTGKSKELTGDSYQLTVEGESLGRYYLRNEALASELESTISIYSLQPGEIVAASSGAALRQVRVYSVNGELVTQRSAVGQTACRLSVPRGAIYMIYAEDAKGNNQSVKLRVR